MSAKKQILIVEDNELNRAILHEILSDHYQVLEAENGLEALKILSQYRENVALVFLDIMMPVMDGYTFLERVKADPVLSLIPVIVMTQSDSEEDEVSALAHGATDFVPKPYRPQVLLHRAASLIRLRETAAMVNLFKYDRLTGLYSKEFFYQKVREQLDENPEVAYTIICSNIENFKLYNDTFGRNAGNRLLKEIAENAMKAIGSTGFCGRFGSDRFMFFQRTDIERKQRLDFRNRMTPASAAERKSAVIRWGIYEITDRSLPVEQMCDRALLAVNSIKGQYNQRFAVYDDSLRSKLLREKMISDAMETALHQKQFAVYLQPKYSLNDNCMAGAEALVRWIHPQWGIISPGEFIPLFEKNGFIPKLDRYVWECVCAQLRDWESRGLPLLPISVNVSRADVCQDNLADTLHGITQKYGVNPAYVHLEVTESAYTNNPSQIIGTIDALRKLGFIIEMDDFGSGYSSLNMLSQMKLDVLKLDMQFVQNEMLKPSGQSILHDIITMAHRLNLNVVAEGVETRSQMKRLQAAKCDFIQGYFFAKPMPVAEYEALLKDWTPPSEAPSVAQQTKKSPKSLLIVDENPRYREKVRHILEHQYHVLEAADSETALSQIQAGGAGNVSAVILSMTLPENGASEVLQFLRQNPALWPIPVLATIPNGEAMHQLPLALEADDFLCKCHPVFDLQKRLQSLLDAESFRQREADLQEEANRDPLTGLFNRRGLQAALSVIRKEEYPLAAFLLDLDNLKAINDTYGHEAGDRAIQSFADLLRHKTRREDILCRYGGDEFLIILKNMNNTAAVAKKGKDICETFRNDQAENGHPASCSIGIALCGTGETPSSELFERADQALYHAKREKKGGCCLWDRQGMIVLE